MPFFLQGECKRCLPVSCEIENTFLKSEVFMNECLCADCSKATSRVNYTLINCTNVSDAVIVQCSSCISGQTYRKKKCTVWSDTICNACSGSPHAGYRLAAACTPVSDAMYALCPSGMACDGGATPFLCILPRVAMQGVCVCSPAM